MPNAVWTGTLSFGLVTLPVRLFPATKPKDVRFHLYDRESGRRVRYRRVLEGSAGAAFETAEDRGGRLVRDVPDEAPDAADDPRRRDSAAPVPARPEGEGERELGWEDLARGVEDELGRVVMLSHDEVAAARPQRSRTIDVEDFVDLADIDPVHFEKTYYVVPASPEVARPYALLLAAMERAGRVGLGRFVLRTKPHLVAIRPMRGVLALETLFFGDEVRDPASIVHGLEGVEVSARELELAEQLIETLRTEWNPAAYADTYREELLRLLAERTPVEPAAASPEPGGGPSAAEELLRALRESVEAAKTKTPKTSKKRSRRAG